MFIDVFEFELIFLVSGSDCTGVVVVVTGDEEARSEVLDFVFVALLSRSFFNRSLNEAITIPLV